MKRGEVTQQKRTLLRALRRIGYMVPAPFIYKPAGTRSVMWSVSRAPPLSQLTQNNYSFCSRWRRVWLMAWRLLFKRSTWWTRSGDTINGGHFPPCQTSQHVCNAGIKQHTKNASDGTSCLQRRNGLQFVDDSGRWSLLSSRDNKCEECHDAAVRGLCV